MLLVEGSKLPTAHKLYPSLRELYKSFEVLKNAKPVISVLSKETNDCLNKIRNVKRQNLDERFKDIATSCCDLLKKFLNSDPAKDVFEAVAGLFSAGKMTSLELMDPDDRAKCVTKFKEKLYILRKIPNSSFVVLHSLLADSVSEALRKQSKQSDGRDIVQNALLGMRENHPVFTVLCLQAIHLQTSNSDFERGFSAYNDIVTPKRCRLLEGNAEVCVCLYLDVDIDYEKSDYTTQGIRENPDIDPDDDFE